MAQEVSWNAFVDTEASAEFGRLRLLEGIFDPFTFRNLDRLGVDSGKRCLEIGGGAGSIGRRLAQLAGPENVTVTDLMPKFLAPLADLGVTVLRHDVVHDDQPGEFDLIHTRFVLDHIAEREAVLKRLASWLKPGGWLLVEMGSVFPEVCSHPATRRSLEVLGQVLTERVGTAPDWARVLPLPLERAGLSACDSEGMVLPARGGSDLARWLKATVQLTDAHAVATGLATREELDEAYALYESPDFVDYAWMTVAAWGQRPA